MFRYSDMISASVPEQSGGRQNIARLCDSGARGRDIIQQETFSSDIPVQMALLNVYELLREVLTYKKSAMPGMPAAVSNVPRVDEVPAPAKLSVLLIDDETIREACEVAFAKSGIRIDVTEHGEAGLAVFVDAPESCDLVVTNVGMPTL